MSNNREVQSWSSEAEQDFIINRHGTVFDRIDFVPPDYNQVRDLASARGLGRNYLEQAERGLKKTHELESLPDTARIFLELITLAPIELKVSMMDKLHEAVEMIKEGRKPQEILDFIGAVERVITEKTMQPRPKSEQSAIDSVTRDGDMIRRDAVSKVAKDLFGSSSGSLSSPSTLTKDW